MPVYKNFFEWYHRSCKALRKNLPQRQKGAAALLSEMRDQSFDLFRYRWDTRKKRRARSNKLMLSAVALGELAARDGSLREPLALTAQFLKKIEPDGFGRAADALLAPMPFEPLREVPLVPPRQQPDTPEESARLCALLRELMPQI